MDSGHFSVNRWILSFISGVGLMGLLGTNLASEVSAQTLPAGKPAPRLICSGCFTLTIQSGDHQNSSPLTPLANPLVVKLTDQQGNPLFSQEVIFEVTGSPDGSGAGAVLSDGSGSGSSPGLAIAAFTTADGTASALLRLGNRTGAYQITTSCLGCISTNFTETATVATVTITTMSIPAATFKVPYAFVFQASGGTPPYRWSVQNDSGSPPPRNYFPSAFAFSNAGAITANSSDPIAPGAFRFVVAVSDSLGVTATKPFVFSVTCGDPDLDRLGEEYEDYGALDLTFTLSNPPACADFTQTAHSVYFTFFDLNKPGPTRLPLYSWALIRYPLAAVSFVNGTAGLDSWVALLEPPQLLNSGYRSPSQNAIVGGAASSRHMWGDAVDLQNKAHPAGVPTDCNPQWPGTPNVSPTNACFTEYNRMVQAAWGDLGPNAGATWVEPPDPKFTCRYNCVHADWRSLSGAFQQ